MYTDESRVENFLQRELNSYESAILQEVISAASLQIDDYTGRSWSPIGENDEEPEAEERFFDGNGSREIFIDDFIGLESVGIVDRFDDEDTLTDSDEWILTPSNKNPKNAIRLKNRRFPEGIANIKVTAIWGGGTPPATVVMVCTELVAKYIGRMVITGPYKRESIEGYTRELMNQEEVASDMENTLSKLGFLRRVVL